MLIDRNFGLDLSLDKRRIWLENESAFTRDKISRRGCSSHVSCGKTVKLQQRLMDSLFHVDDAYVQNLHLLGGVTKEHRALPPGTAPMEQAFGAVEAIYIYRQRGDPVLPEHLA